MIELDDILKTFPKEFTHAATKIRQHAHRLHAAVGQTYGDHLPYSVHLDAVAANALRFAPAVCFDAGEMLALCFGAFFHDSIEDARLTYNDVMKIARTYLQEEHARLATEIVYALTNEKGRNRAERANEKYYAGIRSTPYAPLVKLADRLANMHFACSDTGSSRMKEIYKKEMLHFLAAITPAETTDQRLNLPRHMVEEMVHMAE